MRTTPALERPCDELSGIGVSFASEKGLVFASHTHRVDHDLTFDFTHHGDDLNEIARPVRSKVQNFPIILFPHCEGMLDNVTDVVTGYPMLVGRLVNVHVMDIVSRNPGGALAR